MSVFDLDNELHILLCNSPDNLQWLPANININKSNDIMDYVYENPKLVEILKTINKYEEHRDKYK
jgi:hypothetical protein